METVLFAAELVAIVMLILGYARTEKATNVTEKPWFFSYKKDLHDQKAAPGKEGT